MDAAKLKELDAQYVAYTYARNDIALAVGGGCTVQDTDGKRYLDMTSGIGVNSLGFCDPAWVEAVCAQVRTLQHTSNLFYTQPCAQLAQALCEKAGFACVFFANSGAEANEGAVKTARKYARDLYGVVGDTGGLEVAANRAKRYKIITLENSFHGRTIAMLKATGQDSFHQNFGPFPEGFIYVPANDFAALVQAADETVCAVMLEPVQGEGGVIPLNADYAKQVAALCAEKGILLIADEVQTGMGRTGTLLACEQLGMKPDIVTLAKGLGGGLPIGAVLFGERVKAVLAPGDHGSTYGGNPVACAGANAVVERLTPEFLAQVAHKGELLRSGLAALPHVKSVDGMGLMLGAAFADGIEAKEVVKRAMAQGLLCLTAKTKLRLLPPLIIAEEEITAALQILRSVLEELQ